jgi:hypothetical protein
MTRSTRSSTVPPSGTSIEETEHQSDETESSDGADDDGDEFIVESSLQAAQRRLSELQRSKANLVETGQSAEAIRVIDDEIAVVQGTLASLSENRADLGTSNNVRTTTTGGVKRKFSWFLKDYQKDTDDYNPRNDDGTLKDLESYPVFKDDDGVEYNESGEVPAFMQVEDYYEVWEQLNDVNGQPFYDAEANAIGAIPKFLYMYIPVNWKSIVREAKKVGASSLGLEQSIAVIAGVYALAKEQWTGTNEDEKIKWATLRMEAFKAGWFDNQKYCTRKVAPKNSLKVLKADWPKVKGYIQHAWSLCAFIPFLNEFCFRSYGSCYSPANSAEYMTRAEKFMRSSLTIADLGYMKPDTLYGPAFGWIGMKRVKEVLISGNEYVPNVFLIRANSAPAGQAIITSTVQVIKSLQSANWWDPIKEIGGYDDTVILDVAGKICKDPWKYHQMSHIYGCAPLIDTEKGDVLVARDFAARVAPIMQAYLATVMKNTDLGKIKALSKVADGNAFLYMRMRSMFLGVQRRRPKDLKEAFATYAFDLQGASNDAEPPVQGQEQGN